MASVRDTLLDRIEYDPNGGCWLWAGAMPHFPGYGTLTVEGRTVAAHRTSWNEFRGPIPRGLRVLHHCDVRPCINPDHLFLGTHGQNMSDMVCKGRSLVGSRNHNAKLLEADIAEIWRLREAGETQKAIGQRFGVSQVKISQILLGKAWRHFGANHGVTFSEPAT